MTLRDTGFSYTGTLQDSFGGTTMGTVRNRVFNDSTEITGQAPPRGPHFSGTTYGQATLGLDNTLGLQVEITHGSGYGVITTGDKFVSAVPEPTTMVAGAGALGLALLGIGRARRTSAVRIGK